MQRIPSVKVVMTPFPYSIEADESVHAAHQMMEQHRIRHLPVTKEGRIAGIVSDRDIDVALVILQADNRDELPVWAVSTRDPFVVDIDDRIDKVVDAMADRHISSALVVKQDKLAGIITTTDVYRSFAERLRVEAAPISTGDDAA